MPERYAVFGNPVKQSLSPIIHQLFAEQVGIRLAYDKVRIDEKSFEQHVRYFFTHGGKGLNITLPFKKRAFTLCKEVTERCLESGTANTLWYKEDKLYGDNTDGIGLIRDLKRYIDLTNKKILLLGAGGAARGVLPPLLAAHPKSLTLANRTFPRAQLLKHDFPLISRICELTELEDDYDLIINATSASLEDEKIPISDAIFAAAQLSYDLAYHQDDLTPFTLQAQEAGCFAVDGLGMLVEQAAEAFYIWHGVMPDTEAVLAYFK